MKIATLSEAMTCIDAALIAAMGSALKEHAADLLLRGATLSEINASLAAYSLELENWRRQERPKLQRITADPFAPSHEVN